MGAWSVSRDEPPRVLRRLQLLRRWRHEQVTEVLPRSPGARRTHGAGAPSRLTHRCGQPLNRLPPRLAVCRRPSTTGSRRPRSTAASVPAPTVRMPSASRNWNARSKSCAGPTTSSRLPARFCAGGARPPTQVVKAYIDRHRDDYGVEPICRVLQMVTCSPPGRANVK